MFTVKTGLLSLAARRAVHAEVSHSETVRCNQSVWQQTITGELVLVI